MPPDDWTAYSRPFSSESDISCSAAPGGGRAWRSAHQFEFVSTRNLTDVIVPGQPTLVISIEILSREGTAPTICFATGGWLDGGEGVLVGWSRGGVDVSVVRGSMGEIISLD